VPPLPSNQLAGNLFTALGQVQQTGQVPPYARLPANQFGPSFQTINKGSLVTFSYLYFKPGHDPTPLVIITDVWRDYIRGVNLHYLTFPYILRLLQPNCDNPRFSYYNIKGDAYIVGAFRQYKRLGIRQIKKLDCAFLLKVLQTVRTLDPTQVDTIRRAVRDQINRTVNPPAQSTEEQPLGTTGTPGTT
jgi:hypothetical protein